MMGHTTIGGRGSHSERLELKSGRCADIRYPVLIFPIWKFYDSVLLRRYGIRISCLQALDKAVWPPKGAKWYSYGVLTAWKYEVCSRTGFHISSSHLLLGNIWFHAVPTSAALTAVRNKKVERQCFGTSLVCACGSPKSFIPLAGGVSPQRLHAVFVQRGAPATFVW